MGLQKGRERVDERSMRAACLRREAVAGEFKRNHGAQAFARLVPEVLLSGYPREKLAQHRDFFEYTQELEEQIKNILKLLGLKATTIAQARKEIRGAKR